MPSRVQPDHPQFYQFAKPCHNLIAEIRHVGHCIDEVERFLCPGRQHASLGETHQERPSNDGLVCGFDQLPNIHLLPPKTAALLLPHLI
jgi:hypothetical protein